MKKRLWHSQYDIIYVTSSEKRWRHRMLLFSMIISIRQYGLNEFNSENSIYWSSKIPSLSKSNPDETFQRPSTSIGYIDVGKIWGHNVLVIVFKSWCQIWSFFHRIPIHLNKIKPSAQTFWRLDPEIVHFAPTFILPYWNIKLVKYGSS